MKNLEFANDRPTIGELTSFLSGNYLPGAPLAADFRIGCDQFKDLLQSRAGKIDFASITPLSEHLEVYMRPASSSMSSCLVFNLSCGTPYACWSDCSCGVGHFSSFSSFNIDRVYESPRSLESLTLDAFEILKNMGFVFPAKQNLLAPLDETLLPIFRDMIGEPSKSHELTVFDALFWDEC